MNAARIAKLLRELAAEFDALELPAAEPTKRRRRVHTYKPSKPVSEAAMRDVRRQAAKRGIPL